MEARLFSSSGTRDYPLDKQKKYLIGKDLKEPDISLTYCDCKIFHGALDFIRENGHEYWRYSDASKKGVYMVEPSDGWEDIRAIMLSGMIETAEEVNNMLKNGLAEGTFDAARKFSEPGKALRLKLQEGDLIIFQDPLGTARNEIESLFMR
jgi:hypothetical protein